MRAAAWPRGLGPSRRLSTATRSAGWALAALVSLSGLLAGCTHGAIGSSRSVPASPVSRAEADYFLSIAYGSEYGTRADRLRVWGRDITVRMFGSPTGADTVELDRVIGELNTLAGRRVMRRVSDAANLGVYFVGQEGFDRHAPAYARQNAGYVAIRWDKRSRIYAGTVLVRSDGLSDRRRRHVIREEVTQALGLLNDSERYPESIFYEPRSEVTEFAPIDRAVIRLLFDYRHLVGARAPALRAAVERRVGG